MRHARRNWQVGLGLFGLAAFAAAWLFLAPTRVGGSTIYSITEGNSMQPLLHRSDLALLRTQSSYRVGDVVLYQSPILHRPVLHRILVIQNGHYFFKGDNNDFVDPGYATRAELLGRLWVRVPWVGRAVAWLGKPMHAALFAALVVLLVLLGGAPVARGRRRRRRSEPAAAKAPLVRTGPGAMSDATRASLAVFVLLLLVTGVVLVVGFTTSLHRSAALPDAYRHTGTFSYTARTPGPDGAFPGGLLKTGQPIFPSLFSSVTLDFRYRFRSQLPHQVHGTIKLVASLLSQSTSWQQVYVLEKVDKFTGDTASTGGPIDLSQLEALLKQLALATGSTGDTYEVDLQPIVHIVGVVGGHQIRETFSPILPFSVTPSVIKLDVCAPTSPPGATYVPPTGHQALASALGPVQMGTVQHRVTNFVTLARYHVSVFAARLLGLMFLFALLVTAVVHQVLLRRHLGRPLEQRIAEHFGCLLVPVDSLGEQEDDSEPVEIHDFERLASLARYLERPILHCVAGGDIYAVDDESRQYVYRKATQRAGVVSLQPPAQGSAPGGRARRRGPWKWKRLPLIAGLGALVVVVTLATSFTASTSVPTSNAGRSTLARQISQLAPGGCGSLALTTIVLASGPMFNNTASNALVLGTAAVNTINSTGNHDCFVAGGGKDVVNGHPGDFCQIGPTTGARYVGCATF